MAVPALAIPALLGAARTIGGLFGKGKAEREAERLQALRPDLGESDFVRDQLSLAENELATGMSGEAERAYEEGLDRDLSSSIQAVLRGGGNVNNISELFDRSAQGRQRLTLMRENLRLQQIANLDRARQAAEAERLQRFQYNEYAPWADRAQANASARQRSQDMIWGGLETLGGAASQFFNNQANNNLMQSYLNPSGGFVSSNYLPASTQMSTVPVGNRSSPAAPFGSITPTMAPPGMFIDDYYFPD